ncbi:MAG: LysR family transcriptional regulator [Anaerovoracaceae bacterium]
MNGKQLECFIEVADSLNFTVASANLYLSQPTVTRQIRLLEEELGVQLFFRTKKHVSLTPAGKSFYYEAREILSRILIAKNSLARAKTDYEAILTVGYADSALSDRLIPVVLEHFLREFPKVNVILRQFSYKDLISLFRDGKTDLVFTYTRDSVMQENTRFELLFEAPYDILLPPGHPLAEKERVAPHDLVDEDLILPEISCCPKESQGMMMELSRLLPTSAIHYCDSPKTARLLMLGGVGLSIMPEFDLPAAGNYIARKIEFSWTLDYGIACDAGNVNGKYLRRMTEIAKEKTAEFRKGMQ